MDKDFQERIDEYLLHGDNMPENEKKQFQREISVDAEKRAQYEFTKTVKAAITSREEKLKAMSSFERRGNGHKKLWLWASSIAAIIAIGIFVLKPQMGNVTADGPVRGDDDVFDAVPTKTDSTVCDSIPTINTINHIKNAE